MAVDLAHCKRALGGSCRECVCMLPNGAGWAECPKEARGAIDRKSAPAPHYLQPSGDICVDCGSSMMVRTGTCLTCQACGSSSGGCS